MAAGRNGLPTALAMSDAIASPIIPAQNSVPMDVNPMHFTENYILVSVPGGPR
jgi:hypothetical protein